MEPDWLDGEMALFQSEEDFFGAWAEELTDDYNDPTSVAGTIEAGDDWDLSSDPDWQADSDDDWY